MNLNTLVKSGPGVGSDDDNTMRDHGFIENISELIAHIREFLPAIGPAGMKGGGPGGEAEFDINKIVTGDVTDVTFKSPGTDFLLFLVRVKPDSVMLYASDGSVGDDGKFKFRWYTPEQLVDAAAPDAGGGAAARKRKRKSRRANRKRGTRRRT